MSNEDWAVSEDDLKGGTGEAKPVGDYVIRIENASVEKDKNNRPYIKFVGEILYGANKGGKLFENYLPLGREKAGKNAGQVNKRTSSFLRAIGHREGIPVGAPGGPDISKLNGTVVDVRNENRYENVPGEQYPIRTWESRYDDLEESGALKGIKPRDDLGFYSISDDFEGLGGGSSDDAADEDSWG